ncbi:MAG: hypothetical protein GX811_03440 [Lentisphaerae bacterium]|nr:hypothetical protein [Lentisphaerota bacterium]
MAKQIPKDNTFGIEIEMQAITRRKAAENKRDYFGGAASILQFSTYHKLHVENSAGRAWSVAYDGSIHVISGEAGHGRCSSRVYVVRIIALS